MKTICKCCEQGHVPVPLGEHFITREMAIDAGDLSLEGASMGIEWGDSLCGCCEGNWEDCKYCSSLSQILETGDAN